MYLLIRASAVAALALAVTVGPAGSASIDGPRAPRLEKQPFMGDLGRFSPDVAVAINLDRPATSKRVTVNGQRARIMGSGMNPDAFYTAFARKGDMRVGRSYPVRITMCRHGACLRFARRVFLHRVYAGR